MKHAGELIKNHIETNKLVKKNVAESVGITPTYLSSLFKEESMDCALLEKICHTIGMNPAVVFDTPGAGAQMLSDIKASTVIGPATVTIGETKALQDLLAEKERLIQVLMATSGIKIGTESGQL
jgi:DNA-binding Xre family transcriptional regulator